MDDAGTQARALWAGDVASRSLGMTLEASAPGTATVRMRVLPSMLNGHGICHGGYLFLLADTAFAMACNSRGEPVVAAGADISFLAPAREGDELVAVAVERVLRGRSGLYDVQVRCADEVLAELRGRSRSLTRPASAPRPSGTSPPPAPSR